VLMILIFAALKEYVITPNCIRIVILFEQKNIISKLAVLFNYY